MNYFGVCIGSCSVSVFDGKEGKNINHGGDPLAVARKLLPSLLSRGNVVVTGRKGRKAFNLPSIAEVEATETAYMNLRERYGNVDAVVSAGGENFMLYAVNNKGMVTGIHTGNKCASGTGEFFLQQLKRMGLSLEFANSVKVGDYYELSSRCSVFCKSDCTHALNRGMTKDLILNGLGRVMADKIVELCHKAGAKRIMLVGGASRNLLMLHHLKARLDVVVPEEALYFEALGSRVWGSLNRQEFDSEHIFSETVSSFPLHRPLAEFVEHVQFKKLDFEKASSGDVCILGVDVGSTTTKAILLRIRDNAILAGTYLRTLGDPVKAAIK